MKDREEREGEGGVSMVLALIVEHVFKHHFEMFPTCIYFLKLL